MSFVTRADQKLTKSFDESKHPRDRAGKFTLRQAVASAIQPPLDPEWMKPDAGYVQRKRQEAEATHRQAQTDKWKEEDADALEALTGYEGSDLIKLPEKAEDLDITEPADFVEGIRRSLQWWLAVHTNPEANAVESVQRLQEHTEGEFPPAMNEFYSGSFSGSSPTQKAIREFMADEIATKHSDWFKTYPGLGTILADSDPAKAFKTKYTNNPVQPQDEPDYEDIAKHVKNDDLPDVWERFDNDSGWDLITRATIYANKKEWQRYRGEVVGRTRGKINRVIPQVYDALRNIERAPSNEERFMSALFASHQAHCHGGIVETYGNDIGLDWETINELQQGAPAEFFGQDAIDAYTAHGKH